MKFCTGINYYETVYFPIETCNLVSLVFLIALHTVGLEIQQLNVANLKCYPGFSLFK